MLKNRIDSNTPTTKEWYTIEIKKAYNNLVESQKAYYEAVKDYNQAMSKLFALAYSINLKENMANRVKLTKEYKQKYKELCDMFLRLGKLYTTMLNYRYLLNDLKEERTKQYGQPRM